MAAILNTRQRGLGRVGGRQGRYRPLAEINVTPLVDVMLVLLIIFMVTAPLMTSGVNVDLPKTSAQPLSSDSTPITISINAAGKIFLQDTEVQLPELVAKLQAIAQNAQGQPQPDRRIFVRGDKSVSYGLIMQVMGTITDGGFTKVALLAEQPVPGQAAAPVTPTAAAPAPATSSGTAAPAPAGRAPASENGSGRRPGRG